MTALDVPSGLQVVVTSGVGAAPTDLAAFDAALQDAHVAQFNIVQLSSVLPAGSKVVISPEQPAGAWGDVLYAAYAERHAHQHREHACAGMGWVQDEQTGAGMLVEHGGSSRQEVEDLIRESLADIARRRTQQFGDVNFEIVNIACVDQPVCAVVVASFGTSPWWNLCPAASHLRKQDEVSSADSC